MNRQLTILAVCGGVALLLCCGVGIFLFSAWSEKSAMKNERDQKTAELERIYAAAVFPSDENIAQYGKDAGAVSEWRGVASNLFRRGALEIDETLSPSRFKQRMMAVVRKLNASFRTPAVKAGDGRVSRTFGFDFDRYLGDTLPTAEDVPRLSRQLEMIRRLCGALGEAGVAEITGVLREKFDLAEDEKRARAGEDEEEEEEEEAPRRRRRRDRRPSRSSRRPAPAPAAAAAAAPGDRPYAGKERFVFSFKARPDVLVGALNRLAAMDIFTVVAEAEIHKLDTEGKPGDMLKEFLARRAAEERARAEKEAREPAADSPETPKPAAPPKRRIATDPELDPPSAVKLVIDVYTF